MLILLMETSTTVADLIVWSSPAAFGLALYLAHDAFSSIKSDIKELKERQVKTRDETFRITTTSKAISDSVALVQRGVDASLETTRRLSVETQELKGFIQSVERRMVTHDENYGKVILILRKVVTILRPKPTRDPKQDR